MNELPLLLYSDCVNLLILRERLQTFYERTFIFTEENSVFSTSPWRHTVRACVRASERARTREKILNLQKATLRHSVIMDVLWIHWREHYIAVAGVSSDEFVYSVSPNPSWVSSPFILVIKCCQGFAPSDHITLSHLFCMDDVVLTFLFAPCLSSMMHNQ